MDVSFQLSSGAIFIFVVIEVIWLCALVFHLKESEMKDVDKICWTIVLCVLNVLGLALYMIFAAAAVRKFRSEEQLKQAANEGVL